jgi:protein-L-isoaspartate(D-aspartate) O-methyltransferase
MSARDETERPMNVDFAALRVKMVDGQLRTTDVTDKDVLDAMLSVPREAFVPESARDLAYIDEDLRVSSEGALPRYLMEPSPFGRLVQLAAISTADRVLDVGCATGYSSAVLARLAASVVALESDPVLADHAAAALSAQGCENVTVAKGELAQGWAAAAPFDVILLGGAVDEIPASLFAQLKEDGRLVAVVGRGNAGAARLYVKHEGVVSSRLAFNAAIRPLPGFEREPAFEF